MQGAGAVRPQLRAASGGDAGVGSGHTAGASAAARTWSDAAATLPQLIHVAIAKYADHLPLGRQVQMMAGAGLEVTSAARWDQIEALARVVTPSHERLYAQVLQAEVIGCDESRWRMLDGGRRRWHVWCLTSAEAIYYRVQEGRSREAAARLLGGYSGIVMADGYSVYASLARGAPWQLAQCWAHVRRTFIEAQPHAPREATCAIDWIRELYAVEGEVPMPARGAPAEVQAAAL